MSVTVHHGDCLDVMPTLEAESFDSCITDPPYHLTTGKKGGTGPSSDNPYSPAGRAKIGTGFMGKAWDGGDVAFRPEVWGEVLRLLKPGAHLLAFGGTRTFHRMVVAIEDAGFEIRDTVMWLYGSGFPKSHDVSKGIDKRRTEDTGPVRAVCRMLRAALDARGLKSADLTTRFGGCHSRLIDHWAARDTDSQPALPTPDQWAVLRALFPELASADSEVWRLNGRKGEPGDAWNTAEVVGEHAGAPGGFGAHRFAVRDTAIRAPATPEAAAWQGWGTALKPAWEPIIVARKPLDGTIAANVLAHGTGALNINECRVKGYGNKTFLRDAGDRNREQYRTGTTIGSAVATDAGRWPANVIHDGSEEVLKAFAAYEAPGQQRSVGPEHGTRPSKNTYGDYGPRPHSPPRGDTGTAARFFYSAKADATDRLGSKHPTVKPVDLMRYLCRLVTRPGGLILDPFAGSGTTGMAAMAEGFRAVLIERETEYVADIRQRIAHVSGADAPLFAETNA